LNTGDENGTFEEDVADSSKCCLDDSDAIKLGEIALKVHSYYGNARDIEWGIKSGQIYMLQSRPITNLDSNFTEWEIMHELDTGHHSEREMISRLHWNEVMPGALSHVCLTFTLAAFDRLFVVSK